MGIICPTSIGDSKKNVTTFTPCINEKGRNSCQLSLRDATRVSCPIFARWSALESGAKVRGPSHFVSLHVHEREPWHLTEFIKSSLTLFYAELGLSPYQATAGTVRQGSTDR
jgi:hypothetical protein